LASRTVGLGKQFTVHAIKLFVLFGQQSILLLKCLLLCAKPQVNDGNLLQIGISLS
jgi:hypothetical protein